MATKILVADPSQSTCVLLARACDLIDCACECAKTPSHAVTALDTDQYVLFVCSLDWPQAPELGLELLAHAKLVDREINTILLAAEGAEISSGEAPFTDLHACLPKPLPPPEMMAVTLAGAIRPPTRAIWALRDLGISLQQAGERGEIMAATAHALLDGLDIDATALRLSGPIDGSCDPPTVADARQPLGETQRQELHSLLDKAVLSGLPAGTLAPNASLFWRYAAWASLGTTEEGHLVGVIVGSKADLERSHTQAVLETCLSQAASALSYTSQLAHAQDLASRDSLTGLFSHSRFVALVRSEIARVQAGACPFAVIMLDVDSQHGLKEINDQYGHQAGDRLVVHLARSLASHVRRGDRVARYGGDEFLILAPSMNEKQALALAQKLIDAMHASELPISESLTLQVTLSAGVAVFDPARDEGAESLLARMDRALYAAKKEGPARVHVDSIA